MNTQPATLESDLPMVSVIVPIRNEVSFVQKSLGAVLDQDYPAACLEVIVADGLSNDGTREIVEQMRQQNPRLRLIDNPGKIVSIGLNEATLVARGKIIIRVDGHCEIAPDYVRRCVEHLQRNGVDGVGGAIETIGQTRTARTIAAAMSSSFGVGGSAFRTLQNKTLLTDTIPFPAYRREVIDWAGPYDEELVRNQDDEYNYRLRKLGSKLLLASDVRSRYYSRSSLMSLARQYYQYGFWKVRVLQKHPKQMHPRQFVPIVLVSAFLISLLAVPLSELALWTFGFCLGMYVMATLAASFVLARSQRCSMAVLPIAFAIVHLCYGIGFGVGLIKFWNRWGTVRGTTGSMRCPSDDIRGINAGAQLKPIPLPHGDG